MHPMLNIAVRAARAAGSVIMRQFERVNSLGMKGGQRSDFVSEVDRKAGAKAREILLQAYPGHRFFGDESGAPARDDYQWIIQSLDGAVNYLHCYPQFAVSIALQKSDRVEQGVIYDPFSQELFTASGGRGAWLDNRRLRVSACHILRESLLATATSIAGVGPGLDAGLQLLRDFLRGAAGVRQPGVAALNLAGVAAGRLDGFWQANLSVREVAAGALIAREAGGLVGGFRGGDEWLASGQLVCANPKIFHAMLQVIKPHLETGEMG